MAKAMPVIIAEERQRILSEIQKFREGDPEVLKRHAIAEERLRKLFKPLEDAIGDSTRLTADDMSITINARDW